MADNVILPFSSSQTFASENIAGVHHQRVKMEWGAAGSVQDVSNTAPMPIRTNPQILASASNTGSQIAVSNSSTTILASNASRNGAKLYADPDNTEKVFIKLGSSANSSCFPLYAGDSIDLTFGVTVYTGIVTGIISGSGTQQVNVLEI